MKVLLALLASFLGMTVIAAALFLGYGREKSWERIAGPPDTRRIDLLSVRRSGSANDTMAGTAGLRADMDIVLPAFEQPPAMLIEHIERQVKALDPLAERVDDGDDPFYLRFVTYSPHMRFPDLVRFQAMSLTDGRTGLIAYARAQLGRFDFGANRKRLERYLADIDATAGNRVLAAPALN